MLRKLLLIGMAAVGGIYITSEEGKQARAALMRKKSSFEPIVKDLMKQLNEVLEGSKQVNSDEVRANINMLVKEAKQTIVEIDFEKTVEVVRDALKVASRKIREAENEMEQAKNPRARISKTQEIKVNKTQEIKTSKTQEIKVDKKSATQELKVKTTSPKKKAGK